jgi:hypothetical protein
MLLLLLLVIVIASAQIRGNHGWSLLYLVNVRRVDVFNLLEVRAE